MAAYCDGRREVEELDTFLLQHVMWQRVDNVPKIHDWLLNEVSAEFGNKQLASLLYGIFSRLPSAIYSPLKAEELSTDVAALWSTVVARHAALELAAAKPWNAGSSSLWLSEEEAQAIGTAFSGRITSARSCPQRLMEWAPTMEALLHFIREPANHLPVSTMMDLIPPLLCGYYDSLAAEERANLDPGLAYRLRMWKLSN